MKKIAVIFLLLFSFSGTKAHDFFILPDNFFLNKGNKFSFHLYVGDDFVMEEQKAYKKFTKRLEWINNKDAEDLAITATDSMIPLASKIAENEGLGLIVLDRNYIHITLKAEKFTSYLKEEHLDEILKIRSELPAKTEEHEKYSRYLKSLVKVGNKKSTLYKKKLGQTLEIILLQNPYKLGKGKDIEAQVFFKGEPLFNGGVDVLCKDDNGKVTTQTLKTDKKGKIHFNMDKSGAWMVRITHMIPCADKIDADWESFWGAYTFGVK
jgi:uncharacterized GH25 family protein